MLGGSFGVALIQLVNNWLVWRRERKAKKEDRAAEKEDANDRNVNEQLAALMEATKFILYDRIRYLGQAYIADGEIDFDDRRILNDMHRSYHNGLGGNGDLDILMSEVNRLPLKGRVDT